MEHLTRIGTATLRQQPLDFAGNRERIMQAVEAAMARRVQLLLLPELALTGYGCEDNFTYPDFAHSVHRSLHTLVGQIGEALMYKPADMREMVVAVGLPLMYPGGQVFNATAVITANGLQGFSCKQFLARNGVHYEPRWFSPWPRGVIKKHPEFNVPMGDVVFDAEGIRFGFETCEDSWVSDRPGRALYHRNVDIILNPSASHFAVGKHAVRQRFVQEGSRAFGVAYAYANLSGTENGTCIFDGGCMIASEGELCSEGARLSFDRMRLNIADVSIEANRASRIVSSEAIQHDDQGLVFLKNRITCTSEARHQGAAHANGTAILPWWKTLQGDDLAHTEICYAVANGLWDWRCRTKTNGYVLSLSGGADSALSAVFVELSYRLALADLGVAECREQLGFTMDTHPELTQNDMLARLMRESLSCAYQGTAQSSVITRDAASTLAKFLGATFHCWDIESQVQGYTGLFNRSFPQEPLNWQRDDIALQNIQARTRSPSIWLMANREYKLLIATSNLSEAALGYATMDGDTSGVLSPLAGLSKTTIRRLNKWLEMSGVVLPDGSRYCYQGLSLVNAQVPTAELRPDEQSDEDDLMPYEICDFIMHSYLVKKMWPKSILFALLRSPYATQFSEQEFAGFIQKWFTLFSRNAWKRHGTRASFHLTQVSLDPKAFHRFPLLSAGFKEQLQEMWDSIG